MNRVPKSVFRLPLEKRAEIAFKEAVEETTQRRGDFVVLFALAHCRIVSDLFTG
jgi:hypothetical protein